MATYRAGRLICERCGTATDLVGDDGLCPACWRAKTWPWAFTGNTDPGDPGDPDVRLLSRWEE